MIVAVMIIPLLVCAALVVDVGALYVRRSQLQNAADAGALAAAQECARGNSCKKDDSAAKAAATEAIAFAKGNVPLQAAEITVDFIGNSKTPPKVQYVTVKATSTVDYKFAPIINYDNQEVGAKATAGWFGITGGKSMLPLAFSMCAFIAQTGGEGAPTSSVIAPLLLPKKDNTGCTPNSGNPASGLFGWLDSGNDDVCFVTTTILSPAPAKKGDSVPKGCKKGHELQDLQNTTIILPIYDVVVNDSYPIVAYAAFFLTGYDFPGHSLNSDANAKGSHIRGYFTKFVASSEAYTYGEDALDLGARIVKLTK